MKKRKNTYISMDRGEKARGWVYMAFQLLALPYILSWVNSLLSAPMGSAVYNFVYYAVNFTALVWIFRRFLKDSLAAAWADIWNFIQAVVLGLAAYWACSKVFHFLISLLDADLTNVNDSAVISLLQSSPVLTAIAVVVLAPVTEELLYRGLIFRNIWQTSKVWAYLISIVAFAAIHVVGYLGSASVATLALCFLQYLPAGLSLAWTYSKASNIFAPILVHAIVNAFAVGLVR